VVGGVPVDFFPRVGALAEDGLAVGDGPTASCAPVVSFPGVQEVIKAMANRRRTVEIMDRFIGLGREGSSLSDPNEKGKLFKCPDACIPGDRVKLAYCGDFR